FNRVEREGVMGEPTRCRKLGRVEIASPVLVLPPGAADSNVSGPIGGQPTGTVELCTLVELAKFYVSHYLQSQKRPIQSSGAFGSPMDAHSTTIGPVAPGMPGCLALQQREYRVRRQTSTHPQVLDDRGSARPRSFCRLLLSAPTFCAGSTGDRGLFRFPA